MKDEPAKPVAQAPVADPPTDATPEPAPTIVKRETPPALESPLKIVGHALRSEVSVGCFDPHASSPRWSVSVTLDPSRPCPESGSEVPLIVFDIDDHREDADVPLPQPGSVHHERLYLFQYKKAPDPTASIDEMKGESQDKIMIKVEVLRHDPPYVIVRLSPDDGAVLPKGIKEFGGELAVLLHTASEPYTDLGSWKLEKTTP